MWQASARVRKLKLAYRSALCPAEPFLLGELSEAVMEQLDHFTPSELAALVDGFGSGDVRRSYFDDAVFKG